MPKDAADGFLAEMEQVELAAEPAMITALGLFEAIEILIEVFLGRPRGAVDALQLRVPGVAPPIGPGHVHQLKGLPEMPGRRQMRADAQIDKIALAIEAYFLFGRDLGDVFGLVALADPGKKRDCGVAVPDLAADRLVATNNVVHAGFDLFEIVRGERLGAGEIVVKPGLGRRAESDLGFGIKLLDRFGHDMRCVVAQDLDPLGRVAGDDRHRRVVIDPGRQIARPAVDADGDRRFGEPWPDRRSDVGAGYRPGKLAARAIGQRHDDGSANWSIYDFSDRLSHRPRAPSIVPLDGA